MPAAPAETFICRDCGGAFDRPHQPGRKPSRCPACRDLARRPPDVTCRCENCGETFAARRHRRFCRRRCREQAHYQDKRTCHRHACAACGASFTSDKADRRYCSIKCAGTKSTMPARCETCGETFGSNPLNPQAECGTCRVRAFRRREVESGRNRERLRRRARHARNGIRFGGRAEVTLAHNPVPCKRCGASFVPRFPSNVLCPECSGPYKAKGERQLTCPDCGGTFLGKYDGGRCGPCARAAQKRAARERARTPEGRRRQRDRAARRRARKRGRHNEHISHLKVFDRDAWLCHICGKPVDRGLAFPDPMSASLDHVVPLAKGGTHTYANVACSHLICNSRKSDSLP